MVGRGRSGLVLATLVLITTITAIVSALGAPLVPAIADDYGVKLSTAQWVLTAGLLAGAVFTPIVGRLGSGRLRKPVIVTGLAIVTGGSLLGSLPFAFPWLVVGRTCQGIGLSLTPLALAVARDVLAPHRVPRAIALLSVTTVTGAGLGYPLAAWVAQLGGVHAAYAMGCALSLGTLIVAILVLPPAAHGERQPVDWGGAVLLSLGMVSLLLAISQGEHWGWLSARTASLGISGVALIALWAMVTWRSAQPLVDLKLATRPGVVGPNVVAVLAGVGMYTMLTTAVVLVQAHPLDQGWGLGLPLVVSGFLLLPYSVMSLTGSRLAQQVQSAFGPHPLLPLGCGIFFVATIGLATWHANIWVTLAWMGLGGLGSGFTFSSLAVLMLPFVPQSETGSAMAFNQVLRSLGFSTGSATSIALMAAFGGGDHGFVAALWTTSTVWVIGAVLALGLRPSQTALQSGSSGS